MLSVGTIHFEDRFCASRRVGQGEVGGVHTLGDSALWLLLLLAAEKHRSALGGAFFCFHAQTAVSQNGNSLLKLSISLHIDHVVQT